MNLKNKTANFLFLILGVICFSCQKIDKKPTIEIYTLKSNDVKIEIPYDTIQKEFLYAPKFNVTQDLLNEKPLITDKEILCLDTISGKIELTAEAINKIVDLKSSMKHGIKFVICQNKEPLFTGYFWSSLSSYGSTWNCIEYNHSKKVSSSTKLNIYKGNGMNISKREKINFNSYPELVRYLTESNKLECNK